MLKWPWYSRSMIVEDSEAPAIKTLRSSDLVLRTVHLNDDRFLVQKVPSISVE